MSDGEQSLAHVKQELGDKIDAVDRKVDGVGQGLRSTRSELRDLITATATSLEHHVLKQVKGVAEAAADAAVQRVVGTIWERAAYDASVLDDKLDATNRRLDEDRKSVV